MALSSSWRRVFKKTPRPRWTRHGTHIHSWHYPWANYRRCRRCHTTEWFWYCYQAWKLYAPTDMPFHRHNHYIYDSERARLKNLRPEEPLATTQ